jgi:hypothetical protein
VYNLKITGLTPQQDTEALVKVLLRFPGLNSDKISRGLKYLPLVVISAPQEEHARRLKIALEKLGAICTVEKAADVSKEDSEIEMLPVKEKEKTSWGMWLILLAVIVVGGIIQFFLSGEKDASKPKFWQKSPVEQTENMDSAKPSEPAKPGAQSGQMPTVSEEKSMAEEKAKEEENAAKSKNELKEDLSKNPYNSGAWKALYEKLENEGDTASASKAKASYDKAIKTQLVLSSLAKAFGNDTRVEITEKAVYYRTNKDLNDSEFYYEAEKLREALNSKFPNKDMVLENYSPENNVQTIRLKAAYTNRANQPRENDSPK